MTHWAPDVAEEQCRQQCAKQSAAEISSELPRFRPTGSELLARPRQREGAADTQPTVAETANGAVRAPAAAGAALSGITVGLHEN
jgi:hypothetical protein